MKMIAIVIALQKALVHLITFKYLEIWENDSLFIYLETEAQRGLSECSR